ncbi:23S rRNA (uridine(2479)-2'-O)-methyltransferase [Anaerolineales bacterium]|nr:23S rRNA (uridine(2479)-2'-O)-methyltransferase [Anaerolineales bacterium]
METIISLTNPLVKRARSLHQRKVRAETGLFLVEGIHHVGEVVEAGWEIETVLYAPELLTSSFARSLLAKLTIPPQPVSVPVMESLADKENPQGIVAVAQQKQIQLQELKPCKSVVALVSPQDPGNVGTILRTMDAVGTDALFMLDGGVELYHPTLVRASMGTLFWKPVIQTSFAEFVAWASKGKYQLIGTSAKADVDYQTLVPQIPWVLVLGSEQKGLSSAQTAACDVTVSLAMQGRVSSLNLAVAAGVLLYRYALAE